MTSTAHKRYLLRQRIKTLGLHGLLFKVSSRYRLNFVAGNHALAINEGANLNTEVHRLIEIFPHLSTKQAATAIVFHQQFGQKSKNKG